jgi:transcriptional regulator with XRE-family HTH domain
MKSVHTEEYKFFLYWLVNKRNESGLNQRDLAKKLKKPQSYVSKYEKGERRLDIVELLKITDSLNANPVEIIRLLQTKCRTK